MAPSSRRRDSRRRSSSSARRREAASGSSRRLLLARQLDLEHAADGIAGRHRIVRQLDRLEHLVEGGGHVAWSPAHRCPTDAVRGHETFHRGQVGVERSCTAGTSAGASVTGRLVAARRPRRARTGRLDRSRPSLARREADREEHPAAVREALGAANLADRADRLGRVAAAADLGAVGDHAHHEAPAVRRAVGHEVRWPWPDSAPRRRGAGAAGAGRAPCGAGRRSCMAACAHAGGAQLLVDEGHVDLGALQLARVVDVDALPLAEEVERRLADLAMAVAGRLGAAERQVRLGADGAVVHVAQARVEVADGAEGEVDVAGEERGREAVLHAVDDRAPSRPSRRPE